MRTPTSLLYDFSEWSFIPGPLADPPSHSLGNHEIIQYAPDVIADVFLRHPNMRVVREARPSWRDWAARWEIEDRFIEIEMSLFDTDPPAWGGFYLSTRCTRDDLLEMWLAVRRRCPAVWLHNTDCEIVTPDEFQRRFA